MVCSCHLHPHDINAKSLRVLAAEVDCALVDLANILPKLRRVSIRIHLASMSLGTSKLLRPKVSPGYVGAFDATFLDWPKDCTSKRLACAKVAIDDVLQLIRRQDELKVSCDFIVPSKLYSVNRRVVTENSLATLMLCDMENLILWRVSDSKGVVDGTLPSRAATVEFLEAGSYDFAKMKERHEEEKAIEARRYKGWAAKTGHQGCDCCNYE